MLYFRQIMDAKSAQDAVSDEIGATECANINELTYYVVFSVGVTGGSVKLETAHISGYTGAWSPEGSSIMFGNNLVRHISITGTVQIRRARIASAIIDGTVSIWVLGR